MPGFIDQYFLGYATIQTNGAPLPQRATLNFLGFTVQDDPVNNVTKVLGGSSGGTSGTLVGDVTTATTISGPTAATVVGLQNRTVASAAPSDTYVLTWSAAHQYWYPASSSGNSGFLTSDVQTATIAGATPAAVVSATGAGGSFPIASTGAQITFAAGGATPGLYQTIAASSANPQSMTVAPQAPNAAAGTTGHGTPGSFVVQLAAPVSTGALGYLEVTSQGHLVGQIGSAATESGTDGGLWLGGAQPGNVNGATLWTDPTVNGPVYVQATSAASNAAVYINVAGASYPNLVTVAIFQHNDVILEVPQLTFLASVATPSFTQATPTSDTATTSMTVAAQSAYGTAATHTNGAALHLQGGAAKSNGATGLRGGTQLQLGADLAETLLEVTEVAVGSRGVALAQIGSGISSTNVPSGDGWVWVGKANVNPGVPTAGFVLYADASTGAAYCCNPGGSPFPLGAGGGTAASSTGWYGGGEDGALVLNGTNTYPILQLVNPGTSATYAPYSDVYATTLMVNAGITLASACIVHASVSVTNNGTIDCNSGKPGQPGSGTSAGGNAPAGGTLGGGWAGAAGGVGLATGGGVAPITTNSAVVSLTGPLQGGGGGASSASSGGSGGAVGQIGTRPFSQPAVATGFAISGAGTALVQITGGSGGGGGGSTGTLDAGGGGGSSAGIGAIRSPTITNNGVIKSVGGNGGAGFAGSSNAGGGGGGAGGVILITTNSGVIVGNAPVVTGGTGGAGAGSGGLSGQNGTNGKVIYSQP